MVIGIRAAGACKCRCPKRHAFGVAKPPIDGVAEQATDSLKLCHVRISFSGFRQCFVMLAGQYRANVDQKKRRKRFGSSCDVC